MSERSLGTGGRADVGGQVTMHRFRDLGDLTTRPAAAGPGLGWRVRNFLRYRRHELPARVATTLLGKVGGVVTIQSALALKHYRSDVSRLGLDQRMKLAALLRANVNVDTLAAAFGGQVVDYGIVSRRLVTNNGVGFIVDAFQNLVELELMKFHGFGTGGTAEAAADSALVTELTTQYNPDNTRPTGSQTETSANIYRSVGTLTPDSGGTIAVTEHGLFSANTAGVLLDRSLFSAVNIVAAADSLQATYDFTITAGG